MEIQEIPLKHGEKVCTVSTVRMVLWNKLPRDITQNSNILFGKWLQRTGPLKAGQGPDDFYCPWQVGRYCFSKEG